MTRICPFALSVLLILSFNVQLRSVTEAFNFSYIASSTFLFPGEFSSIESAPDHSRLSETSDQPPFLKDVLKTIAAGKKWDLDKIRVLKLEKARFAYSKRHDYRVRSGKSDLVVRLSEKLGSWKRFDRELDEVAVNEASSKAVLPTFVLDGPLELIANGDDRLSLHLPLNTSVARLKRVLVGEGIRVHITGAQEFSFFHKSCSSFSNESSASSGKSGFWPLLHPFCRPFVPVHILGSASLVALRASNPGSAIKTKLRSKDTVVLEPDKCYVRNMYRAPACGIKIYDSYVVTLENLWKRFMGERIRYNENISSSSFKMIVKSSTMVQFQLEMERVVASGDSLLGTLEEWRTKPTIERLWFDVVTRVDDEGLKPISVKGVRPFVSVDSAAWSSVMSNMSFTKFPATLLPTQTLTLDIK